MVDDSPAALFGPISATTSPLPTPWPWADFRAPGSCKILSSMRWSLPRVAERLHRESDRPLRNHGRVTPALELRGLCKRYDDGTLALDALDLEVPAGSFFGLLGPNGAGKTTLISAVCNLIRPTDGEITVFGHPGASMEARRLVRSPSRSRTSTAS